MKARNKPKWFPAEQRGGRKELPLMPAALTLYKITASKIFTKATGVKFGDFLLDLSLNGMRNYVRADQWNQLCGQCYGKVKKDPDFQKKLVGKFNKKVPGFLKFCKKTYKSNLDKKTNRELWQVYEKYIRLYEDIYVWGEPFAFGARFQLSDYLSEYLKKILEKKDQLKKFDGYFNTLITPRQKPFITEEKENLLKIAAKINKSPKLKKLFNQNLKIISQQIARHPAINKKIVKHTDKYQWVPYNYGAYLFAKRYFLKELKELISKDKITVEKEKIDKIYRNLEDRQRKIIKELKIDKYHQKLFEALRWNGFIIDYKKKVFTLSHFYINFSLMKEIAKRLKIEQKFAHCLLEQEVKDALLHNKVLPLKVLESRYKRSVIFIHDGKIKLMVGKERKKFLKNHGIGKEKKIKVKELKGQATNKGIAKGKAMIILGPKDFKKMRGGNILVTHMTTPEFIPIFKKASAIITDEGGITCHAAIISRELKVPCIVGTKIATQVFKDGDLVEVDANEGIVSIIK